MLKPADGKQGEEPPLVFVAGAGGALPTEMTPDNGWVLESLPDLLL